MSELTIHQAVPGADAPLPPDPEGNQGKKRIEDMTMEEQMHLLGLDEELKKPHSSLITDPAIIAQYQQLTTFKMHDEFKRYGLYWAYRDGKKCIIQAHRPFEFQDAYALEGLYWVTYQPPTEKAAEKWTIDEPLLCVAIKAWENIYHINGRFYNASGVLSDDAVRNLIRVRVIPFINTGVARVIDGIFKLLATTVNTEPPVPDPRKVYTANGTTITFDRYGDMSVDTEFSAITLNRLPVVYDPKADCPGFLNYLRGLLEDDDIITVQQFCGYLLLPTTMAQVALFLRGDGGEGKSVLLNILSAILGASCTSGKLASLETNRFKLATLEHKLAFFDDDLQTALLSETTTIKNVITSDAPVQAERKGKDSFEFRPYARIMCCGNTFLGAMHDRSDGLYRRMIPIEVKPAPADRVPDRQLTHRLIALQLPGILNWMLQGASTVIATGYNVEISARSKKLLEDKQRADNPVQQFMEDASWVTFTGIRDATAATKDLKDAFCLWAKINGITPPADRSITTEIARMAAKHGAKKTDQAVTDGGRRARGYYGVSMTAKAKEELAGAIFPDKYSNRYHG